MLKSPCPLPSSSQRHLRFSKCHAEMFGQFPADCFSGCRLAELCRLPMLCGPSGYSQPCAGAAFLSAHSLHHGSARDTPAAPMKQLRSPPGVAPQGLRTCVQGAVRLRPGGWTSIMWGQRGGSSNVKMPFLICLQHAWGLHRLSRRSQHCAESEAYTSAMGKAC